MDFSASLPLRVSALIPDALNAESQRRGGAEVSMDSSASLHLRVSALIPDAFNAESQRRGGAEAFMDFSASLHLRVSAFNSVPILTPPPACRISSAR